MNRLLLPLLLIGSLFLTEQALAHKVSIKSLRAAGSGCPAEARPTGWLVDTNRDGLPEQFVASFPAYVAKQGSGFSLAQRRRNCALVLTLNLPEGLQYAIVSVRFRGHAGLPASISGLLQADYDFPFASRTGTFQSVLRGPFWADFDRPLQRKPQELVWSSCDRDIPLNIRTQLVLSGPRSLAASLRTTRHSYGLIWRHCRK